MKMKSIVILLFVMTPICGLVWNKQTDNFDDNFRDALRDKPIDAIEQLKSDAGNDSSAAPVVNASPLKIEDSGSDSQNKKKQIDTGKIRKRIIRYEVIRRELPEDPADNDFLSIAKRAATKSSLGDCMEAGTYSYSHVSILGGIEYVICKTICCVSSPDDHHATNGSTTCTDYCEAESGYDSDNDGQGAQNGMRIHSTRIPEFGVKGKQ